jgi:hypothetical protein
MVAQLVKKFPAFNGSRRFVTVFTRVRNWALSWATWILSTHWHYISFLHILIVLQSTSGLSFRFSNHNYIFIFPLHIRATCPTHFIFLDLITQTIFIRQTCRPGVLSLWLANVFCNTVSLCMMRNSYLISENTFVNVVSIWQWAYLSLWETVQLNEECQIKKEDESYWWIIGGAHANRNNRNYTWYWTIAQAVSISHWSLSLGFHGYSSMHNFGFREWAASMLKVIQRFRKHYSCHLNGEDGNCIARMLQCLKSFNIRRGFTRKPQL